ncbi:glycoside hydrolase family 76 protein [Trichoderma atroviride IMI 206040]|uniref:Mannan endo-1,6-alpha-mannosidase n=1 Tax=Hypocrea atroviridis (strain ATCC 20476 / IMI 206040) TaxID=452589 RepID=G9PB96_HYPAI|nr:glycoside hydrolase family 76 protein [Trichoderma atroviride IMI 206040]EHK39645.1 glycoside hydrolase family 76 protein [Trichoderma atroviride IMI 206040]
MKFTMQRTALALALLGASAGAIKVDFTSDDSIKAGASTIAYGLVKYYNGNETGQIPGNLPQPYYWWETGAMFATLIDYMAYAGVDTYLSLMTQGMLFQAGKNNDFLPQNQTMSEGNDDQGVWALAALSAYENALGIGNPNWQGLGKNVFNDFVQRWDSAHCGGGLRWQMAPVNAGYDYKNSASNGVFFDVAARLFQQMGQDPHSEWATKVFEWEQKAGLISDSYQVFDGLQVESCNSVSKQQSSMNAALFLEGSAYMYNATSSSDWKTRVDGLLKEVSTTFVKNGVLYEPMCEEKELCTVDQQSYKSFLIRALKATAQQAPYTAATIQPLLQSNAKAAAASCSGSVDKGFAGQPGTACGFSWIGDSAFDGNVGVGEQMNALSALTALLPQRARSQPSTTSGSGSPSGSPSVSPSVKPKSPGNKIAANLVTVLALFGGVVYGLC